MTDFLEYLILPSKVYTQIENAVVRLLMYSNVSKIPIDPFEIAKQNRYEIIPYSSLNRKAIKELFNMDNEAVNFYNPNKQQYEIYYDDELEKTRIRFTLMHEIGHIVMGHREESELARRMADYFAAYTLAPSPLIFKYKCHDALEVASIFLVSQQCAEICFQRFTKWLDYGGQMKDYEEMLVNMFESGEGSDAYGCA